MATIAFGAALLISAAAVAQQVPHVGTTVPLVPGQDVTGMQAPEPGATAPQDVTGMQAPEPGATVPQDVTGTQAPEPGATVPQARFETITRDPDLPQPAAPRDELQAQPQFVRAPGEGGIEISPLAPPDGAEPVPGDILLQPQSGTGLRQPQGGAEAALDAQQGEPVRQPRFKAAPEHPVASVPDASAVPIDAPTTDMRRGVRLRQLDKMTGQTETFELAATETRQIDRLKVRLEACRSPEGNDTHGTMAFLKVWDVREPDAEAFSGWMFAEAPSLSALDHPRYDLWVISCTTSEVAASSASE